VRGRAYGSLVVLGSAVLEGTLVRTTGPPAAQVRVLGELAAPGADPVGGLLACLALAAELLAAYVLAVVVLGLLAGLPGLPGRLAAAGARTITVPALRRTFDGLLGGAFLAQSVLVPAGGAAGHLVERAGGSPPLPMAADRIAPPAPLPPWLGSDPRGRPELPGTGAEPLPGGPTPRPPGAPAPQATTGGPPTATGGPPTATGGAPTATGGASGSGAGPGASGGGEPGAEGSAATGARRYTIKAGDTLWAIAASQLPAGSRSAAAVDTYWRQLYAANRTVLGDDPDLIHPGTLLLVPPFRSGRR
jgi:nucleoid-associated protein YgaU